MMKVKLEPFFRHRWKFVLITAVFWAAAAVCYFQTKPSYVSEAKLMVRYVIDVDADGNRLPGAGPGMPDPVVIAEMEVLTSRRLLEKVVEEVGADRLVKGGGQEDPLSVVTRGLTVRDEKDSTVILLAFRHADAETAQATLKALIHQYFQKHLEIHRTASSNGKLKRALLESFALFGSAGVFRERAAGAEGDLMQPRRMPNVDTVQGPTPGIQETRRRNQVLVGMIAGGPVLGLLVVMMLGARAESRDGD